LNKFLYNFAISSCTDALILATNRTMWMMTQWWEREGYRGSLLMRTLPGSSLDSTLLS